LFVYFLFLSRYLANFHCLDKIIEELGAGGYGKVHRVQHKQTGAEYVLKQIKISDGRLSAELLSEITMPKEFNCPYIVKIYQTMVATSAQLPQLYLQQEYCDDKDLLHRMHDIHRQRRHLTSDVSL
jgi:serine/threonine protein kinase